ncbi:MAG TPA: hypothetical protein VFX03_09305 [Thermomicrobiales bacterium]|nr:hypothetical protein [Thermomicrobiales bacterium]
MAARSWRGGWRYFGLLAAAALMPGAAGADPKNAERMRVDQQALAPLQVYVGGWRGVGQLRRGSNQGAWTEQADWAWKFDGARAALAFDSPRGKYYLSGELSPGEKPGVFELSALRTDGKTRDRFAGRLDDKRQLVLVAKRDEPPAADSPDRISLRTVADGDRLLVLYERRLAGGDRFTRLSEVGYTRQGSSFAKGSSLPECVVTGGLGTIEVTHQGKTYLVCCTGCRDLFKDDPEGVLADYRERKAKEKAEQSK